MGSFSVAGKVATGNYRTGWDGREAVVEATGPSVTVDGKKYQLLGYDAKGSPVYEDARIVQEQEAAARREASGVVQEESYTAQTQESVANSKNDDTIKKISGARITDQDSKAANEHAERNYGLVRSMRTDVSKIAKVSGYIEADIQKIKDYIFYDTHDLGDGEARRFDPSFAMAQSWQRLMEGHPEPHDLTMLRHELLEMDLVKSGLTQNQAHIIASKEYNYAKESEEYYGALKEYKNRR